MRAAQTLYEAGLITYMRTDSSNISSEAIQMCRGYIAAQYGDSYLPEKPNRFASRRTAQEAHEAIRPTDVALEAAAAGKLLSGGELKLYNLIWSRFVACQMPPAQFDATTVLIHCDTPEGQAVFRGSGRRLVFDGYLRVAGVTSADQLLPELSEGQPLFSVQIDPSQHFTQPPPRYTEASLVKALEAQGIGRPSTYAAIIQTIQDRGYVEQMDRRFRATLLGKIVTDKLVQGFPRIMDVKFTANMEDKLDAIEEQHLDWVKLLQEFYGPFHDSVQRALENLDHAGGTPSPYTCDKCARPLLYRISKRGFFLACSGYPECSAVKSVDRQGKPVVIEQTDHKCPTCSEPMIRRIGRFGPFLGCSGYPECKTILNLDKDGNVLPPKPKPLTTQLNCAKCGKAMYLRRGKRGPWLGCSGFPRCKGRASFTSLPPEEQKQLLDALEAHEKKHQPDSAAASATKASSPTGPIATGIDCEECNKPMVIRFGKRGPFLGCSGFPKCRHTEDVPPGMMQQISA